MIRFMPGLSMATLFSLLPAVALAQDAAAGPNTAYLMRLLVGLGAVVAVIIVLAWIMRRMNIGRFGTQGVLHILGGAAVGQRERVVLVQVGEQQLLLGVAPGSVRMLHRLDTPLPETDKKTPTNDSDNVFRSLLQQVGQQS